jgi:hypothetical protein
MTVALTGSGGLFTRLGKIGKVLNEINTFVGTTVPGDVQNIQDQYQSNEEMIPTLESDKESSENNYAGFISSLQTVAQTTMIDMVNNDVLQVDQQLSTAITELIIQMQGSSNSIQSNTLGGTITADSGNIGNGVVVVSMKDNNGKNLEGAYNEVQTVTCVADAQTGGLTSGNESFVFFGQYPQSNELSYSWPMGSGSQVTTAAVSASLDNQNNNLLTDGDFEDTWTANVPANWAVITGTAGTEILQETSLFYTGANALKLVGTGTDPKIAQAFGNGTTGTAATLRPLTTYAVSFWARASAATTGSLVIRLYDVTNSAVMEDASTNSNSSTVNLTSLTTTYQNFSAVFRTPRALPASYRLEIGGTTIQSGHDIYVDHVALAPMIQTYSGGPFVAVFSGSIPFILNDGFGASITNNYASGWGTFLERMFNLNNLGLVFPTSGSPTIADSLLS